MGTKSDNNLIKELVNEHVNKILNGKSLEEYN